MIMAAPPSMVKYGLAAFMMMISPLSADTRLHAEALPIVYTLSAQLQSLSPEQGSTCMCSLCSAMRGTRVAAEVAL